VRTRAPTGNAPEETVCEPKVERNPISVSQAVNFAWSTFKKKYALFSAVLLTIFGSWVCLEIVVIAGQRFGILFWVPRPRIFLDTEL
jgi:hypothetical protein